MQVYDGQHLVLTKLGNMQYLCELRDHTINELAKLSRVFYSLFVIVLALKV